MSRRPSTVCDAVNHQRGPEHADQRRQRPRHAAVGPSQSNRHCQRKGSGAAERTTTLNPRFWRCPPRCDGAKGNDLEGNKGGHRCKSGVHVACCKHDVEAKEKPEHAQVEPECSPHKRPCTPWYVKASTIYGTRGFLCVSSHFTIYPSHSKETGILCSRAKRALLSAQEDTS